MGGRDRVETYRSDDITFDVVFYTFLCEDLGEANETTWQCETSQVLCANAVRRRDGYSLFAAE
jgi:hypothetical protein